MKSLLRTVQAALTEIQPFDVPLRVLVSEPDTTSRRLISAVLQSSSGIPTTIYGSGLGADASPRVLELQAEFRLLTNPPRKQAASPKAALS